MDVAGPGQNIFPALRIDSIKSTMTHFYCRVVLTENPSPAFAGMSPSAPLPDFAPDLVVDIVKCLGRCYMLVIVCPPGDDWIKQTY